MERTLARYEIHVKFQQYPSLHIQLLPLRYRYGKSSLISTVYNLLRLWRLLVVIQEMGGSRILPCVFFLLVLLARKLT